MNKLLILTIICASLAKITLDFHSEFLYITTQEIRMNSIYNNYCPVCSSIMDDVEGNREDSSVLYWCPNDGTIQREVMGRTEYTKVPRIVPYNNRAA